MKAQPLVEIEPSLEQRQLSARVASQNQIKKADLEAIAGSEMLILATAIAKAVVTGLEMRERRRERRLLFLAACGLATLIGLARLAVQLMQQ